MRNRIKKLLKISAGLFIILILGVLLTTIIYEKKASRNITVNLSKRIIAEGGSILAKFLSINEKVNNFSFGPKVKSRVYLNKESNIRYLDDNFGDSVIKIIRVKNYKISELAKDFQYENFTNPKLKLLRRKYGFDELVSDAQTELDKTILLRDWIKRKISRGMPKNVDYNFNALDILSRAEYGETFFCSEYSTVFVQCALSLGFTARYVGLFKGHVVAEIWSNEFAKWIIMDIDNNFHYEKDGIPLNTLELHDIWESKNFSGLTALQGNEKNTMDEQETQNLLSYYHEFYIRMRNDWFSNRYPHWHPKANSIMNGLEWKDGSTRNKILVAKEITNKEVLYFPLNITSIYILKNNSTNEKLQIMLDTFTPNFSHFLINVNGRELVNNHANFDWYLSKGKNLLKICSVNSLGVKGPISHIEIDKL